MQLRNIAIIAHVDHGKTTLVDELLKQSGTFRDNQQLIERAMDSNDLERERGITILAKCTSVVRLQNDTEIRINIVDTPGHTDFGGEVERILSMVDGVLLLVDAAEGPMPQTKFVTAKALGLGLKPIVVINKADKPEARISEVHEEVFDLFASLGANEEQLDFPVLIASAKQGWAKYEEDTSTNVNNMDAVFTTIIDHVTPPKEIENASDDKPFIMLATTLEADPYVGRLLAGKITSGILKPNMILKALSQDGKQIEKIRVTKILAFRGLTRQPIEQAEAGDIITVAGFQTATVADTLCSTDVDTPVKAQPIDPPTLSVTFQINNSPLAGRDGDKVQSRVIRDRLMKEAEGNVALQVNEGSNKDEFEVAGRGELQLGVLIETMRREGFEMSISRPKVLYMKDPETSKKLEPIEEVTIDVDDEYSGVVIEKMNTRKAELLEMKTTGGGKTRLIFNCPSRGLIGYQGEFMTDTRGTGIMNRIFRKYDEFKGDITGRRNGVLVSNGDGDSVAYALASLEERGILFIGSGVKVYKGMIIGENAKSDDLDVNPLKAKQLTNMRAAGKDDAIRLTPPRLISLEQAIAYINDDELVEVTPKSIRLRKRHLDINERKKAAKAAAG